MYSSLMFITPRPELVMVEGDGSWITDDRGRRYLDFVQGWAVNCLGHAPAAIADAVAIQARKLINVGPAFYNEPMLCLADLLVANSGFDKVFFANSGAEANEGAIKLARKWGAVHRGGAYEIVTFDNAFHGRTLATMSASGKAQWQHLFEPKVPGFPKVPLNDIAAVERAIGTETVAVMLEPIQGEAGVIPASTAFLRELRCLTRERGILLIVDEVQTGMGRTGRLFAHEHAGMAPDIMTLGKGLGGGVPISALLALEEVCCFETGDQGGTFNGNPLTTAAAVAVMRMLLQPGFLEEVARRGEELQAALSALARRYGPDVSLGVRGCGLLQALVLGGPIAPGIVRLAFDRGLLLNAPRSDILRFMPALNVTTEEIRLMVDVLEEILDGVGKSKTDSASLLRGQTS